MIGEILLPAAILGGMGALFGAGLAFAGKKLAVPVDERIERRGDKYHIDLKSINRLWLLRSGLDPSRIDVHPDCTKCRPDRYWSHRGMGGERGGMAAVIVLTEDAL